jgi:hypothetical protein
MNGSFPNPVASKEEKAKKDYGIAYARAIWAEHSKNAATFDERRTQMIVNRKYAEGLQSVEKYKNRLDLNGDSSYVNLDFSPVNRIPALVNNIVGKLMNQTFKIQCNPIDSESLTQYDDYRKKLYANMFLSKLAPAIEEKTGIPVIPMGEKIPKSKDDIEMHLKLNYKMDAAMSMETAIHFVNKNNLFEETRRKIIRDIVVLKKAALYRYYDAAKNICHEYVDPVDLITPYSKYDDFRNITYQGILKQYQIWELALKYPKLTDDDLYNIARTQAGVNKNPQWEFGDSYEGYYRSTTTMKPYMNFNITELQFFFITQNSEKRIKKKNSKGGYFFSEKPSSYSLDVNPNTISITDLGLEWGVKGEKLTVKKSLAKTPEEARTHFSKIKTDRRKETVEVLDKKAKYRYEGCWIPGTDWMLEYKMSENIEREKINGSYSPDVELPISIIAPDIFDMQNKSLVESVIPIQDQMILAHLKIQQDMIKAVPPGIAFDIDKMDGIITSMGEGTKPTDILKMYQQTGSIAYSGTNADNTPVNGKVIDVLPNGLGSNFLAYISVQQHLIQQMNDAVGYNSAVDASSPDSNALVGVQKMAAQATQNALRPHYASVLNLILRSTERLVLMIQDSMEFNEEAFVMAIGEQAAATIKYGRKVAFNQFAIDIELSPDEEEKFNIEQKIQLGLKNGTLFVSDSIRIEQELKHSAKLAAQLLVLLENKNKQDKIKESMSLQQQNGEVQTQAAQAASQFKQEEMQLEVQSKSQLFQVEYNLKDAFEEKQFQRQMKLQELKNQGADTVAVINSHSKVDVQNAANEGKIIATQVQSQSKETVEHLKHNSKVIDTHLQHESAIKQKDHEYANAPKESASK